MEGIVKSAFDEVASARPLSRRTRAKARFALWLASRLPLVYRKWSLLGARRWRRSDAPWAPLEKPIEECTVALINSGGIILKGQQPFDLENPAGDCSYRIIPGDADLGETIISHAFYDSTSVRLDTEVLFPLGTLRRFAAEGRIGRVAPRHFSFSGSIPDPTELDRSVAPQVADMLASDEVDLALLTPA
ncbi:MAG: hypothetical protein D6815_08465 [Candidatus Dadabacteria bacterium]|nr:MAG: hypothetical protein D6815_08465 [Candidatus Dadabacteria bacterium]